MKQNFTHKGLARLYFIMRVSIVNVLLLITPCLQVVSASPVNGQNVSDTFVNIDVEHVSLKKVFDAIEDQTDFLFVYPSELVGIYSDITVKDKHGSVQDILNVVLRELPIAFKEEGDNILLFRKLTAGSLKEVVQTITGKVVDVSTGTGLPGVSVIIKGTINGTTTDADGRFAIDARTDDILIFSSVGFKNQEISVAGRSTVDVQMEEDIASLNEVVINGGYYTTTEETKIGNIAKVSEKEIRDQPVTSPLLALQGRAAGVDVSPLSGMPGDGPNIKIRGNNSFRFNGSYPLYVIDGVPVDSSPIQSASSVMAGSYDPLSTINPSNIASIEILKDADATSIYGSRGANGVVLITTKHATDGKTSADINFYRGIGQIANRMEMLNTKEYLELRREAFKNNNHQKMTEANAPDFLVWDTTRYTDWQKELMGGTAIINDLQGSMSGGNSFTSFRIAGGYHKETTVFPGDFYFQRLTGSLSINHLSRNKKLKITVSANYGVNKSKFFNAQSPVFNALKLPPNAPALYKEDGTLNWAPNSLGSSSWVNPLADYKNTNDSKLKNLIFNSTVSYNIGSGFFFKTNLGYSDLNSDELLKYPTAIYDPQVAIYYTAESNLSISSRTSWIAEPQMTFFKRFGDHGVDFLMGSTFQEGSNDYKKLNGTGYASDALLGSFESASDVRVQKDEASQYRYTALFARVGYDWKEKYYISVTGRRDGSSRFGSDNRFGNFGSVGAAWIFSKEPIISDHIPFISFGKVRGSVGITGNDQIGDYQYVNTYSSTNKKYYGLVGLLPTSLSNPEYKWEVNRKLEGAIEMSFIKNRLSIEVAWYRNRSSNQLVDYKIPGTTGFGTVLRNLDATIENRGMEYILNLQLINNGNFRWSAAINFSKPTNKLISFPEIENSPYNDYYVVGEPLTVNRLYSYTGVNPETGLYTFVDVDTSGTYDLKDRIVVRDIGRKYFGGILNSVSYKNIELSFLFQFVKMNSLSYATAVVPGRLGNVPKYIYDRHWRESGDVTDVQMVSTASSLSSLNSRNNVSDNHVESASFLRLKTVSISYSVPMSILNRINLQQCRLYCQGQNLFTVTDFFGIDPETGSTSVPPLRMVTLGIQIGI